MGVPLDRSRPRSWSRPAIESSSSANSSEQSPPPGPYSPSSPDLMDTGSNRAEGTLWLLICRMFDHGGYRFPYDAEPPSFPQERPPPDTGRIASRRRPLARGISTSPRPSDSLAVHPQPGCPPIATSLSAHHQPHRPLTTRIGTVEHQPQMAVSTYLCPPPEHRGGPQIDRLAAVTGRTPHALAWAIAELGCENHCHRPQTDLTKLGKQCRCRCRCGHAAQAPSSGSLFDKVVGAHRRRPRRPLGPRPVSWCSPPGACWRGARLWRRASQLAVVV
ncbi:hypothetical protein DFJ69_6019 [Thermomonospora umbrina]|uniref:Uncharacterized protein n=1 Tax=Thermomonospora umbrina TaxID=111806 RepID=A0A3D9SX05_9ACTN|nr:hypothetical protein DFJ69_6019 [Thermomonospora umbrina]